MRPGHPDRQAAGLQPLPGHGARPLHPARGDRRGHVRDHEAVRPGVRRHLRDRRQAADRGGGEGREEQARRRRRPKKARRPRRRTGSERGRGHEERAASGRRRTTRAAARSRRGGGRSMAKARARVMRMSVEQPLWRALTGYRRADHGLRGRGSSPSPTTEFARPWVAVAYLARARRLDAGHAAQGRQRAPRCTKRFLAADLTVAARRHPAHPARRRPRPDRGRRPDPAVDMDRGLRPGLRHQGRLALGRVRLHAGRRRQHRRARRAQPATPSTTCCWSGSPPSPSATSSRWPAPPSAPSPAPWRSRPRPGSGSGSPATSTTACSRCWRWCSGAARRSAARRPSWAGWRGSRRSRCAPWSPSGLVPASPRVVRRTPAAGAPSVRAVDGAATTVRRAGPCDLRALLAPYAGAAGDLRPSPAPRCCCAPAAATGAGRRCRCRPGQCPQARRGEDARAWILVEDEPDEVIVTVRDDGPGIPEGRLAQAEGEGRLGVALSIRGRLRDLGGTRRADLGAGPGHGSRAEGAEGTTASGERRGEGGAAMTDETRDGHGEADGRPADGAQGDGGRRPPDVAGRGRPRSGRGRLRRGRHGGRRRRRPCAAPRPPRPTCSSSTSICPACRASRSARNSSAPTPRCGCWCCPRAVSTPTSWRR